MNAVYVLCLALISQGDLTVITPGLQSDRAFPVWVQDMAVAITNIEEKPESRETIKKSIINLSGAEIPGHSTRFILLDWAAESRLANTIDNAANVLFEAIHRRIENAEGKIDIHLIGHSRGCFVNAAAIKKLAAAGDNSRIRFLKMTTLDPRALYIGDDGDLISNPGGIVDWTDNYYQHASGELLEGKFPVNGITVSGALNVDLTNIVKKWSGRTLSTVEKGLENHSEVHDWYHWTWDQNDEGNLNKTPYQDFDIKKQRTTFFAEKRKKNMATRRKLYWTTSVVENFRGGQAPQFQYFSGLGSHTQRMPRPIDDDDVNKVKNGYLQLNPLKPWISTSTWLGGLSGGFTVEFTFKISGRNKHSSADGITFTMLDAKQSLRSRLGRVGGELGYGGLNGLAVAFDNFWNPEYGDPKVTNRTISLRANGLPQWLEPFEPDLPEPINSGNKFRVRISVNDEASQISIRIYSYGSDRVITMNKTLPKGSIPWKKIVGFTSATGEGAANIRIEEVILVKNPE